MKYRKIKKIYKYKLAEEYKIDIDIFEQIHNDFISLNQGRLIIREDYAWDGPSGPAIDDKTNMTASLVHDALYQLMREGSLDRNYRKLVDEIFRNICLRHGMNKLRAWFYYQAVRIFSRKFSFANTSKIYTA